MKILGFDLGDGESAVTLLDEDSTVEPRVIPLCGKTSLLSAVGIKGGAHRHRRSRQRHGRRGGSQGAL